MSVDLWWSSLVWRASVWIHALPVSAWLFGACLLLGATPLFARGWFGRWYARELVLAGGPLFCGAYGLTGFLEARFGSDWLERSVVPEGVFVVVVLGTMFLGMGGWMGGWPLARFVGPPWAREVLYVARHVGPQERRIRRRRHTIGVSGGQFTLTTPRLFARVWPSGDRTRLALMSVSPTGRRPLRLTLTVDDPAQRAGPPAPSGDTGAAGDTGLAGHTVVLHDGPDVVAGLPGRTVLVHDPAALATTQRWSTRVGGITYTLSFSCDDTDYAAFVPLVRDTVDGWQFAPTGAAPW